MREGRTTWTDPWLPRPRRDARLVPVGHTTEFVEIESDLEL